MASDFGRFSTYQCGQFINIINAETLWFGLASTDPFIGDPLAAEMIGGTYVRQEAAFALTSSTILEQTAAVLFKGLPPGAVIVAVEVFDARFGGNLVSAYVLAEPIDLPSGGSWSFGAGDYVMGLDVATV